MTRECARPYSHWNYWLMQMLGKFGSKTRHIFCPSPLFKNVPAPLSTKVLKAQNLQLSFVLHFSCHYYAFFCDIKVFAFKFEYVSNIFRLLILSLISRKRSLHLISKEQWWNPRGLKSGFLSWGKIPPIERNTVLCWPLCSLCEK